MKRSAFFQRALALLLLGHLYVGLRLLHDLAPGAAGLAAGVAGLALSGLLIPLAFDARRLAPPPHSDRLAWLGFVAMGLFSSLFVLTLLRDLALLTLAVLPPWAGNTGFRAASAAAVPLLAATATLLGFYNARRPARVVDVGVPIAGLPEAFAGFTIVQLSDIHVGPTIKRGYLDALVDRVNALRPDLVAITGDLVDGPVGELAVHTAPLARLRAPEGVCFVTGNHEYYAGAAAWVSELRRLGVLVLENEHRVLWRDGAVLVVAGVTDFSAHLFDPGRASDPAAALAGAPVDAAARILLAHQPRSAPAAAAAGFDLQLSGHTHGGQFFPWNFFVRLQQPYTAGLHRLGRLWIYISRGAGYWGPPKRLGAPSEITRLRLFPALRREAPAAASASGGRSIRSATG